MSEMTKLNIPQTCQKCGDSLWKREGLCLSCSLSAAKSRIAELERIVAAAEKREASQMTDAHAQAAKRVADAALAIEQHGHCTRTRLRPIDYYNRTQILRQEYRAAIACYSAFAEPIASNLEEE